MRLLALLAILTTMSACDCGTPDPTETTLEIQTDLPSLAADVAACRQDDAACEAICTAIIGPPSSSDSYLVVEGCFINDTGPNTADLTMQYYWVEPCDF